MIFVHFCAMTDKLITHGFLHCCTVCRSIGSSPPHCTLRKNRPLRHCPWLTDNAAKYVNTGVKPKAHRSPKTLPASSTILIRGPRSSCLLRVILDQVTCQPLHWVLWTDLDKLRHACIGKGKCDYVFVDPRIRLEGPTKRPDLRTRSKGNGQYHNEEYNRAKQRFVLDKS